MSRPIPTDQQLSLFTEGVAARVVEVVEKKLNAKPSATTPLDKYPLRMRRDQVAQFLNCSKNHVQNLVEAGELEAINIAVDKHGRKIMRVTRDSVAAYDAKNRLEKR